MCNRNRTIGIAIDQSTSREQRVKAPSSLSGGGLVLFEDRRGVGSCRTIL